MRCLVALALALAAGVGAAAVPDLNGVWQALNPRPVLRTVAGGLPPLLPEARKVYEQRLAAARKGDRSLDPTTQCQPPGLPRIYSMGMPFQIQQSGSFIYMLFQWNRLFRVIEMNVTHEQQNLYTPVFLGFAVGRWEGDTLVTDATYFDTSTFLDDAGLPHGEDMHVIERFRLTRAGKQLTARIRIDDPSAYSAPWDFELQFKKRPGVDLQEDVCLERLGIVKY